MNSYQKPTFSSMIFAFVDGLLIMAGIFIAAFLRFGGEGRAVLHDTEFLIWKLILTVFTVQIVIYYFDLYEFRNFREKTKMAILLLEALGISSFLLAVLYYLIPNLAFGRGIFALSIVVMFALNFVWRVIYPWVFGKAIFKEKILIIGTGELARKIQKEIFSHGQNLYEIVGFVSENGEGAREKVASGDNWRFSPDFLDLPGKSGE